MDHYSHLPDAPIKDSGPVSKTFLARGIQQFRAACSTVHELPYGYNSDREDLMILFKENMGSCTTKHAVIATLAAELGLPVHKNIGIYAMTEALVTGTDPILVRYHLPYLPMVHCFLAFDGFRVDLTEGNRNGKNGSIDVFLHAEQVIPNISARDEYRLYRKALTEQILKRADLAGVEIKAVLHAREEGLALLKANLE